MRSIVAAAAITCVILSGCNRETREPQVTVQSARVQLPVVEGRPGVAYFTLETNRHVRITSVTSPRIDRIELHETSERNGVSRMTKSENVSFEHELVFEPGGRHAMLFGIDPSVTPGSRVPLVFAFDQAPPAVVEAQVVAPGAGHGGH